MNYWLPRGSFKIIYVNFLSAFTFIFFTNLIYLLKDDCTFYLKNQNMIEKYTLTKFRHKLNIKFTLTI